MNLSCPFPVGTRVSHYGQKWAWSSGIATATVRETQWASHYTIPVEEPHV